MLFHSSVRKELARTFGATLVVLVTVVMTTTVIRTLSEATRGVFNPSDVLIVMGYTVLSQLPTILSLSLFIGIVSVLTRMYRDSEMVIWLGSGQGIASLLRPLLRFAWPIFVVISVLAFVVLPWAFGRIEDLRDQYEKRGDIARVEPGQFQESANGDRVFFIGVQSFQANLGGAAVGNVAQIAFEHRGIQAQHAAGHGVFGVAVFQFNGFFKQRDDFGFEFRGPQLWVFQFDLVDQVDAKIAVHGLVTQDVLVLFSGAGHLVLAA